MAGERDTIAVAMIVELPNGRFTAVTITVDRTRMHLDDYQDALYDTVVTQFGALIGEWEQVAGVDHG